MYIGSFNGIKPIREDINPQCKPLFEKEQSDLLADLHEIPVRSCDRKARCLCVSCNAVPGVAGTSTADGKHSGPVPWAWHGRAQQQ